VQKICPYEGQAKTCMEKLNEIQYCENTESCNDMLPLTKYKETLQASPQMFSKSSLSYPAAGPVTGYLFPYLLQHTLFNLFTTTVMLENQQILQLHDHNFDTMILQESTTISNINISQQLNSIKLSQASSYFKCFTECSTT
jgi:hypothetical protein